MNYKTSIMKDSEKTNKILHLNIYFVPFNVKFREILDAKIRLDPEL